MQPRKTTEANPDRRHAPHFRNIERFELCLAASEAEDCNDTWIVEHVLNDRSAAT